MQNLLRTTLTALALAVPLSAAAAELGQPVVKSHIGQPLVADIELLPDEGGLVRATLANEEVYQVANIVRPPVLGSLHMSVMRRDGRQFLHITSIRPVEKEYLHLFLDLIENGKRSIRPATLWLTPEPPQLASPRPAPSQPARPAPPSVAAAAPKPAVAKLAAPKHLPAPDRPDTACMALDYQNAQLSAQIVDLEEKVKALQLAVDLQATPAPKKPAPVKATRPVKRAEPGASGWILYGSAGAGVLALFGAGGWFGRRWYIRRKAGAVAQPPAAGE